MYLVWNTLTFLLNSNKFTHFFNFSRRLFAKHQTLRFLSGIFSSRFRSLNCCHSDIDFTWNCILTNSFHIQSLVKDKDIKQLLRRLKNIGMVSQKRHRNTLINRINDVLRHRLQLLKCLALKMLLDFIISIQFTCLVRSRSP